MDWSLRSANAYIACFACLVYVNRQLLQIQITGNQIAADLPMSFFVF